MVLSEIVFFKSEVGDSPENESNGFDRKFEGEKIGLLTKGSSLVSCHQRVSGHRLGPIKASPGVPLTPRVQANGALLVVFGTKKGDILLEWVIWGSGKLQCEAFIGPRWLTLAPRT